MLIFIFEGDGEVVPASDGADVQPSEEATHPRESSPGKISPGKIGN